MHLNKSLQNLQSGKSIIVIIAATTLAAIVISIYSLSSGWFTIFQNLFYVPIIIACMYYSMKGFTFSIVLSFIYLLIIITYTGNLTTIKLAVVRTFIFVGIAGITTFLSIQRKRAEHEHEVLYAIGEAVNTTANLDELLKSIYSNIKKIMYADNCYIALYDAGTETISFPLFFDLFDPTPAPRKKRRGFTEYVLRTAKPLLLTPELLDEIARGHEVEIIGTPPESWLGVPLFIQSKPIGVLVVQSYKPGEKYTEREKDLLVMIGNQVAVAIERKMAEEKLRESEERYRNFIEQSYDGFVLTNNSGVIIEWNEAVSRISGLSRQNAIGFYVIDIQMLLIDPQNKNSEYRKTLEKSVNNVLKTGQGTFLNKIIEYNITLKDGKKVTIQQIVFSISTGNGYNIGFILRDVSDRKQAEGALRESENLLRESQIIAGLGSYVLNFTNGFWISSDILDKVFGIDKAYERSVQGWTALIHPDDRTMMIDYFRNEVLDQGQVFDKVYRIIRPNDQAERWVHGLGKLEFDAQECPLKMYGTIQDITERKQSEKDLIESHKQLEKTLVRLEETQRQVLQQEKLRSLGQMASGIVHDINNSLTPIMGYIDLLSRNKEIMKKEKDALDKIFKSAKRIASTVERLRTFYKINIDDEELSEIDLNKLINQSIEFTSHRWKDIAESTGSVIKIEKEFQNDLPSTKVDENELIEALTNVILNACDAMPTGGLLTITTHQTEDNIVIEIKDTGMGMDAETLEHCIDPFFTTKGNRGTGLGLAMVFGVIERHKGEIRIESEKNKGTIVKLIIPVEKSKKEKKIVDEIAPLMQPLKILNVEDDETISSMIRQMLKIKNHEVKLSSNGKLGLELYKQELENGKPFDLIITDLGMAEMDGISLSKVIKDLTPDIPIILLTGWGTLINKDDYPAIDYLLKKPITIEQLYKAINKLFSEK